MTCSTYLNRIALPVVAALCVLGLAACGGQGLTRTGFLSDYDRLHPQPDHEDDAIYVKPGFSATPYTKVIVEPVAWVPDKRTPDREPQTKATLQANLHDAMAKALSSRFTVVDDTGGAPTSGTLRVRAAITNTRRGLWWVNVPAQAAELAAGGIGLLRPSAGGASEEIDVRDASTNEQVVAIATYNNGLPYNFVGSYVAFGHARRAFRLASQLTRDEIVRGAPASVGVPAAPVASASPTDGQLLAGR